MTTQPMSQCAACAHFHSPFSVTPFRDQSFCDAFPDAIPEPIYRMALDHRQPIDGDHGIQWESNGQPYPEYALAQ